MDILLFTIEPFLTGKPLKVWLNRMGITDWSINANGLVDVVGDVDLDRKLGGLKRLPVRFGQVDGGFFCSYNQLVSLEGAPKGLGGGFSCEGNQLANLDGMPKEVGGHVYCSCNQLVSLEGGPEKVGGDFYCNNNQLVSLKGAPKTVGCFNCHKNQLVSLEGGPQDVGGYFGCRYNQLVSLEGAPKKVGGDFDCSHNKVVSLEGAPKEVGKNFHCDHNLLVGFKGLESLSIEGNLVVTTQCVSRPLSSRAIEGYLATGQDNIFVSLEGLAKNLYSKVVGLDIQALIAVESQLSGIPDIEI